MRNKSDVLGVFGMVLTLIFIGVYISLVLTHEIKLTKECLWFIIPFTYSGWLYIVDDKSFLKRCNKVIDVLMFRFKNDK